MDTDAGYRSTTGTAAGFGSIGHSTGAVGYNLGTPTLDQLHRGWNKLWD